MNTPAIKINELSPELAAQLAAQDRFPLDDTTAGRALLSAALVGYYSAFDATCPVQRFLIRVASLGVPLAATLVLNNTEDADIEVTDGADPQEELKKLLDLDGNGKVEAKEVALLAAGAVLVGSTVSVSAKLDSLIIKGLRKVGLKKRAGLAWGLVNGAALFGALEYDARRKKN